MPDFSHLTSKPAGEAKKPPVLPQGDYPGVIKSFELGDQNKNKTPYLRLHLGLIGWPDNASPLPDVDLSKRQFRRDFYLTEDALHRLDTFMRQCGVPFDGVKSYDELFPNLIGAQVKVSITQYLNEKTNEIANQADSVVGLAA